MRFEINLALVLVIILLAVLIFISGTMQEEPGAPPWPPDDGPITPPLLPGEDRSELQFEFTEGLCSGRQNPEATIELEGDDVVFSGFITTSNPCYTLSSKKILEGNELKIEIQAIPTSDICVLCLGEVPFSGKITGLEAATYNVKVETDGLTIAQKTITIPEPPIRPDYPCETVDDCKDLNPLIKCLGYWVCTDNKCEYECGRPAPEGTCTSDSDCGTGGCSGQICGFKDEVEGLITTCEWREEYGCLRLTSCGCIDGTCRWVENDDYLNCIAELTGGGTEIPTDKYVFVDEHMHTSGRTLWGQPPMLAIDFPTYSFDEETGVLTNYAAGDEFVVNDSLIAVYGSGSSLSGSAGMGAGTAVSTIYSLPADFWSAKIESIEGDGLVHLTYKRRNNESITLSPGETWNVTEVRTETTDQYSVELTTTYRITNYGLLDKSKIETQ